MFRNPHNHEETKILHKDIMKDKFKDKSSALISKKPSPTPDNDSNKSSHPDCDDE